MTLGQQAVALTVFMVAVSIAVSSGPRAGVAGGGRRRGDPSDLGWLVLLGLTNGATKGLTRTGGNNEETITLYRAVEDGELADIYQCNKCFREGDNGFPKQFWEHESHAQDFGNKFILKMGGQTHFHVVSGTISQVLFEQLDFSATEPGIGQIVTVPTPLLPTFNYEVKAHGGINFLGTYP